MGFRGLFGRSAAATASVAEIDAERLAMSVAPFRPAVRALVAAALTWVVLTAPVTVTSRPPRSADAHAAGLPLEVRTILFRRNASTLCPTLSRPSLGFGHFPIEFSRVCTCVTSGYQSTSALRGPPPGRGGWGGSAKKEASSQFLSSGHYRKNHGYVCLMVYAKCSQSQEV